MNWLLRKIRGRVYKSGRRPRPGSILYSPSLALYYAARDAWRNEHKALYEFWGEPGEPARKSLLDYWEREQR